MAPPSCSSRTGTVLADLQVLRGDLALLAALDLVADLLALIEGAQIGALDGRNMHEHILRAVIGLNETIALLLR